MSRRYFGTDGVRGEFGGPVINASFAWRLGAAAGKYLAAKHWKNPVVLIGRDTRFSGPELEQALAAGLQYAGAGVRSLGVVPTPAVSNAVRHFSAALGVVITASHNPAKDNGIKFFNDQGFKLDDDAETQIESMLPPTDRFEAGAAVTLESLPAEQIFLEKVSGMLPASALQGWSIVVDAGNGAACRTTPQALTQLGAKVVVLSASPDGHNINADCGSQHPAAMCEAVRANQARLGLAHDGDADRVILADETGVVLDGDEILAILARHLLDAGRLKKRTLVATVQSNLGLKCYIEELGGCLVQTAVGDRYVVEAMLQGGYNLGGESSGHIICTDVSPCGDGLVAALLVLGAMLQTGQPLSELRRGLVKFPQWSRALAIPSKPPIESLAALSAAIAAGEERLADDGRILVRYSGTESKIRLLVEGRDEAMVQEIAGTLKKAVHADLPN